MTQNRTNVADVDRERYDFIKSEANTERVDSGLTPEIIREISQRKDEPEWMLEHRL